MEDIEKKLDEAGSLDEIDAILAESDKTPEEPKVATEEPKVEAETVEENQPAEQEAVEVEPEKQPVSTVDSTTKSAEKEQPKIPEVVPYKRLQKVVEQKNQAKTELEQMKEQLNAAIQELENVKKGIQPKPAEPENPLKGDYYVPADKFDEVLERKLTERQEKQQRIAQENYVNTVKQATNVGSQFYGAEYNTTVTQQAVEYLRQVEPAKYAELEQITMSGNTILLAKKMYEYCDSLYEKPTIATAPVSVGRTTTIKPASKTEQVKKLTDADIEQMINNATTVEEANEIYEKYIK